MVRKTALAFLIAPLWAPVSAVPYAIHLFPYPEQRHWIYIMVMMVAIFAYGGVFAFGMPAFLLLRARKRTAFWIAPLLGFAVGAATWLVFVVLFGLSLGYSLTFIMHGLPTNSVQLSGIPPTGALGAIVGATFWLIARPDRNA